jgi:hypothetical protein
MFANYVMKVPIKADPAAVQTGSPIMATAFDLLGCTDKRQGNAPAGWFKDYRP